jgi:hypothetical protein
MVTLGEHQRGFLDPATLVPRRARLVGTGRVFWAKRDDSDEVASSSYKNEFDIETTLSSRSWYQGKRKPASLTTKEAGYS